MKFQDGVLGFLCCLSLCTGCTGSFKRDLSLGTCSKCKISPAYLESAQVIRQKGYPSETHTIVTEDGYLLSLNRIPRGVRSDPSKWKGPVLLQHGLLGQSIDFLLLKPEKDLAFMLADDGYDVWLGNFRGNTHSRGHVCLTPDNKSFWNFTWHESGVYDLPAMIDFILETTNTEKLEYMGHSMGTTAYLVMLSERPEYNKKISKGHLLAPVAFLKHIRSPLIRATALISNTVDIMSQIFSSGAFLLDSDLFRLLRKIACDVFNLERKLCTDVLFLIGGADSEQFDKDVLEAILHHYPAGYSVKGINHYAQLLLSGEFRQYDYGRVKNIEHYGISTPPSYNLKNVTTPTILYVGPNDYLGDVKDAKKLSKNLSSLEEFYLVKFSKFNHFDFVVAKEAKTLLYDEIMKRLTKD